MGARTKVRRNAAEKATEWLYSRKAGTFVNETTIAAAVSVAAVATKFAVRKGASLAGNVTRAATFGLVNAGVGVTAAIRESMHVKQDSQTHIREMALGGGDELTTAGKYREELEETRFETVSFQELMSELETAQASAGGGRDGLQAALAALTHVRTRINLSDEEEIDLITYTSRLAADVERTKLDIKLAEARVAVQTALDGADTTTLSAAGIDILKKDARDVGTLMDTRSVEVEDQLLESVDARDEAVRKLARRKALKAGITAMVVGDILGDIAQEIEGAVSSSEQGVFEKNTGQTHRTMLAGIFRHDEHNPGAAPNADNMTTVGQHAGFVPPEGYNLQHVDGKWELFDSHNNVVDDNVTFDSDGHLSEVSQHDLTEKGFHFAEHSQKVSDPNVIGHHDVPQTPNEYVKSHPHEFTHMHRTEWMANNTEKPDLNEDRLDWGGTNGTGVDEHGNYVLSVARMTPDGSFEGGLSENARQLMQEGKLKVALSMTEGTQSHVVMVSVDKHGNALIEKGSFAARAMFSRHDGQLHFTGAYAEAVALGDTQPNGTQNVHVLATVIGENHVNHDALIDHQPTIKPASHEQIITSLTAPETTTPVEMPPVLPIRSRRGLEYASEGTLHNPNLAPFYYGGKSLEELRSWMALDPDRHQPRRQITNPDGTKSWVEVDGSPVVRSTDRERSILRNYLEKQSRINSAHYAMVERVANAMKPMDKATRVSVNIPAWMEGQNLTHLLSEFTDQVNRADGSSLSPELYEINILINRKTGTAADDSVAVIDRFIVDFERAHGFKPNVNYYDIELDPPYNNVGYARKLLTDAVSMRSVNRPEQDGALYYETEDADMINVDKRLISNLIDKMDNNPQLDAVRGVQDRSPKYMMQNDMLFLRRRAADFFELLASKKEFRDPNAPNWNFTWNRVVTGGWNTGYSAEAYGLIDGYDVVETGEDMSVGEKITMVRGDGNVPNLEVVGKVYSRSDSSPRRFIHEILTDKGAYAGDNFSDEEANQLMRDKSLDEALESIKRYARIDASNEGAFTGFMQWQAGFANSVTPSKAEAEELTKRLMFWLGFEKDDYEIVGDGIAVKSWGHVKQSLEKYRQRYEAKTGVAAA
jgi:hypothetical protein